MAIGLKCSRCGHHRETHTDEGCTLAHCKCKTSQTDRRSFTTFKPKAKGVSLDDFLGEFYAV